MFQRLFDFALTIPQLLLPFTEWLLSDQVVLGGLSPLEFFGFGGFLVILGLHVAHLVNVVSG